MHHIAAGDASFEDIQGYVLIYLWKCDIILTDESEINNGKSGHYEKENNQ